MVGKHEAKLSAEHLSSVDFTAPSKTFRSPAARGPGVSAIGGAWGGDGERDSGFVAEGILAVYSQGVAATVFGRVVAVDMLCLRSTDAPRYARDLALL